MITDDERREVAAKLRGNPEDTLIPHRTGRHYGMGCYEAADRFWNMCYRIKEAGNYDIAFSTTSVLADLIEPTPKCSEPTPKCDRDALLELADEMGRVRSRCGCCNKESDCDWADETVCLESNIDDYARRIREALGADS